MAAARKQAELVTAPEVTLAQVTQKSNMDVRTLQKKQLDLAKVYKQQKKVEVTISPMYAPYFGKNMPIIINGIPVYVPVNGVAYKIPESYARIVKERVKSIDTQIQRQKRLSDVRHNSEKYVGQRDLISRA